MDPEPEIDSEKMWTRAGFKHRLNTAPRYNKLKELKTILKVSPFAEKCAIKLSGLILCTGHAPTGVKYIYTKENFYD